jgi:hypothetical protein
VECGIGGCTHLRDAGLIQQLARGLFQRADAPAACCSPPTTRAAQPTTSRDFADRYLHGEVTAKGELAAGPGGLRGECAQNDVSRLDMAALSTRAAYSSAASSHG